MAWEGYGKIPPPRFVKEQFGQLYWPSTFTYPKGITPNITMTIDLSQLEGLKLPEPMFKKDHPAYNYFAESRDQAVGRANKRIGILFAGTLRDYHAQRVSPTGKAIKSIRSRMGKNPYAVRIGYMPSAADNQMSTTSQGVNTFMLSVIKGVPAGKIHPPWFGKPWRKTPSTMGAIYGSKEFSGVEGGRLGYWAKTHGILPRQEKYLTKQQTHPRHSINKPRSMAEETGSVFTRKFSYGKDKYVKYNSRRKPGMRAAAPQTEYKRWIPGGMESKGSSKNVNQVYRSGHWKVSKTPLWNTDHKLNYIDKENARRADKGLPALSKDYVRKLKQEGAPHEKTWEMMAKFIAAGMEKNGVASKPVMQEWYYLHVGRGRHTTEINSILKDELGNWAKESMKAWRDTMVNKQRTRGGSGKGSGKPRYIWDATDKRERWMH